MKFEKLSFLLTANLYCTAGSIIFGNSGKMSAKYFYKKVTRAFMIRATYLKPQEKVQGGEAESAPPPKPGIGIRKSSK